MALQPHGCVVCSSPPDMLSSLDARARLVKNGGRSFAERLII
jgi:hypothetical protein